MSAISPTVDPSVFSSSEFCCYEAKATANFVDLASTRAVTEYLFNM